MKKLYVFVALVSLLSVQQIFGQITFSDRTNFSSGFGCVAISDLNGDGKLDMVVGGDTYYRISVYLNTTSPGAVTPTFSTRTNFTAAREPRSISMCDFNGDGKQDMAIASQNTDSVTILLNTTSPGAVTPTFSTKRDFKVASGSMSCSTSDINGDGKPDLIVANLDSGNVSILLNTTVTGASIPFFSAKTDSLTGASPYHVSAGDINGDGKPDLAVISLSDHAVSILMNTTTPGNSVPVFTSRTEIPTGYLSRAALLGDLNGDGKLDMAVVHQSVGIVSVFLNTSTPGATIPTFTGKTDFAIGSHSYDVCINDLNNDGKPDLAVTNMADTSVSILLNRTVPGSTTPEFSSKTDFATEREPYGISVGDLNGDGKQDLVISHYVGGITSVLLNTTPMGVDTAAFSARTNFGTGDLPFSASSGDLNGDGMPDLAVANSSSNSVSVLLNTTSPGAAIASFSAKTDFTTGTTPRSVSIDDFNGDGMLDLATANNGSNTVSVLLNTTVPGASVPVFSAKTDFATGAGPNSVINGDLNGDGKPDLSTANFSGDNVSILLNTTTPGAATPTFSAKVDSMAGNGSNYISTADLNGDGKLDLVTSNQSENNVSVLLNATTLVTIPTFRYRVNFTVGSSPHSVSIGDLNGDGKPDLMTANYTDGTASVLLNTTTPGATVPTFSAKTDSSTRTYPFTGSIADLNGDGKPDLAVASGGIISVLLNRTAPGAAAPSFSFHKDFAAGNSARGMIIKDVNGDGKQDLIVPNMGNNDVSVLLNKASFPVGVEIEDELMPEIFKLTQNYPNPFNPSTKISFTLTKTEHAKLTIYNLLGRQVATLFDGLAEKQKEYTFDFNASNLSSGIYFYRIQTHTQARTRKMILIK